MKFALLKMRIQALKYALESITLSNYYSATGKLFQVDEELLRQAIKELLEVLDGE